MQELLESKLIHIGSRCPELAKNVSWEHERLTDELRNCYWIYNTGNTYSGPINYITLSDEADEEDLENIIEYVYINFATGGKHRVYSLVYDMPWLLVGVTDTLEEAEHMASQIYAQFNGSETDVTCQAVKELIDTDDIHLCFICNDMAEIEHCITIT